MTFSYLSIWKSRRKGACATQGPLYLVPRIRIQTQVGQRITFVLEVNIQLSQKKETEIAWPQFPHLLALSTHLRACHTLAHSPTARKG